MRLSKKLMGLLEGSETPAQPMAGRVSLTSRSGVSVVGNFEHRRIPLFAPGGYGYLPLEEERLLLLPLEDGLICMGVEQNVCDLEPGEVRLTSAGGATIVLKNSGEVEINGLRITKEGELVPPKGVR